MASSSSDCLIGLRVGGNAQLLAAGHLAGTVGGREKHEDRPGEVGSPADFGGDLESLHVRHLGIEEHQAVGFAPGRGGFQCRQGFPPSDRAVRPHPPVREHLFQDGPVRRVIVHNQGRSPSGSIGSAMSAHGVPHRGPKRAVKWKRLPCPTSLSTQIRPPMSPTNWEQMASPRPVPPNRRVVELSAWVKASKIDRCLSAGIPSPVSVTQKFRPTWSSPHWLGRDLDDHLAVLGELDRIAHQVDDHLAQADRVADHAVGDIGVNVEDQLEPLLLRPLRQGPDRIAERFPEVESRLLQLQLAAFDLRKIQDVVDDAQQRLGRVLAICT